jgi:hypothetical protein
VDALELLASLERDGVTVELHRPTGKLRVRPVPVPVSARELLQSHRELLVEHLNDAEQLLAGMVDTVYEARECNGCGKGPGHRCDPDDLPWYLTDGVRRSPTDSVPDTEYRERYKTTGGKVRTKIVRHVWRTCNVCGQGMLRPESDSRVGACVMTPHCPGRYVIEKKETEHKP